MHDVIWCMCMYSVHVTTSRDVICTCIAAVYSPKVVSRSHQWYVGNGVNVVLRVAGGLSGCNVLQGSEGNAHLSHHNQPRCIQNYTEDSNVSQYTLPTVRFRISLGVTFDDIILVSGKAFIMRFWSPCICPTYHRPVCGVYSLQQISTYIWQFELPKHVRTSQPLTVAMDTRPWCNV